MLIHPWDTALDRAEWQDWLATTNRFGVLAVNNLDPAQAPIVVPTHFTAAGEELLIHLARPDPVWPHLEAAAEVRLAEILTTQLADFQPEGRHATVAVDAPSYGRMLSGSRGTTTTPPCCNR